MMMRTLRRSIVSLVGLALGFAVALAACGPPPAPGGACRYNPHCGSGAIGAYCGDNDACQTGYCCGKDECDGGMCTVACKSDPQCPAGMLCQHDACFYACVVDADCAAGQKCKHDRVCEW